MRDTGDFKVTAGNTAWLLHDVYFATPDPDAGPAYRNPEADRPHSTARPVWAEPTPGVVTDTVTARRTRRAKLSPTSIGQPPPSDHQVENVSTIVDTAHPFLWLWWLEVRVVVVA